MRYLSDEQINSYMMDNGKYFESSQIPIFTSMLASSENITLAEIETFKFKSPMTGRILSVLLGLLGIDRFYSGNYLLGILKLITFGLYGVWWIVDWFLISKAVKKNNQNKFYSFLTGTPSKSNININMDTIKKVVSSKEVRESFKEFMESGKELRDTFDVNKY